MSAIKYRIRVILGPAKVDSLNSRILMTDSGGTRLHQIYNNVASWSEENVFLFKTKPVIKRVYPQVILGLPASEVLLVDLLPNIDAA